LLLFSSVNPQLIRPPENWRDHLMVVPCNALSCLLVFPGNPLWRIDVEMAAVILIERRKFLDLVRQYCYFDYLVDG
jgi:hypothetical protein